MKSSASSFFERGSRRALAAFAPLCAVVALLGGRAAPATESSPPAKPSIVLVHGALTDASVWDDVIRDLRNRGYVVAAPAMPLRGLASDAAYLTSFLGNVPGPVVLVGHSWAGQVITQAAEGSSAVKALVYVAAFEPDDGETAGALNGKFPGSKLGPDTTSVLDYPGGKELYLKQSSFRDVYAGDVDADKAAMMAVRQRPIDPAALGEPLRGHAAWHSIPSWALISTRDNSIPTVTLRFMAQRAHSRVKEIDASHAIPVAHPAAVVRTIIEAAQATAK
jgi:pimeloyl-ACP methyl ester carboxylesterase